MQLRLIDKAGLPDRADRLAAHDIIPFFDQDFAEMRIGRDIAVLVLEQDQLAVTLDFAADVGDLPAIGRAHGIAFRGLNIDTVIVLAVRLRTIG